MAVCEGHLGEKLQWLLTVTAAGSGGSGELASGKISTEHPMKVACKPGGMGGQAGIFRREK